MQVALIKLRHLKEQFEYNRLMRGKSIKYELNSCPIKIVDDALMLIGINTGLLKNWRNGWEVLGS